MMYQWIIGDTERYAEQVRTRSKRLTESWEGLRREWEGA